MEACEAAFNGKWKTATTLFTYGGIAENSSDEYSVQSRR